MSGRHSLKMPFAAGAGLAFVLAVPKLFAQSPEPHVPAGHPPVVPTGSVSYGSLKQHSVGHKDSQAQHPVPGHSLASHKHAADLRSVHHAAASTDEHKPTPQQIHERNRVPSSLPADARKNNDHMSHAEKQALGHTFAYNLGRLLKAMH